MTILPRKYIYIIMLILLILSSGCEWLESIDCESKVVFKTGKITQNKTELLLSHETIEGEQYDIHIKGENKESKGQHFIYSSSYDFFVYFGEPKQLVQHETIKNNCKEFNIHEQFKKK